MLFSFLPGMQTKGPGGSSPPETSQSSSGGQKLQEEEEVRGSLVPVVHGVQPGLPQACW